MTYSYNMSTAGAPNRNLASFTMPAQTIHLIDANGANITSNQSLVFFIGTLNEIGNEQGRILTADTVVPTTGGGACKSEAISNTTVHLLGMNYMFADGHVKWLPYSHGGRTVSCGKQASHTLSDGTEVGIHREGVLYWPDSTEPGGTQYR